MQAKHDFQAERDTLKAEFEELKQRHLNRILKIMQSSDLSEEEKKAELQYEKFLSSEEESAYQKALSEINESEAE